MERADIEKGLSAVLLFVSASLTVHRATAQAPNQQTALKIMVIAGEDAVNIIQQKTAVAPVVEICDRNDLPVSGAAVTFTISGGNTATFTGGLQTLTVTTNAAGRAAVSALNPLAGGAFQINVQAAFQGQAAGARSSDSGSSNAMNQRFNSWGVAQTCRP